MRSLRTALLIACFVPQQGAAHVSEQGLVLLLPTELYILGGVATVTLTFLLLGLTPDARVKRLFQPVRLPAFRTSRVQQITRLFSALVLVGLIFTGRFGHHDPFENPLTLVVWTVFWIGLVSIQGVVFDVWRWINPFRALAIWKRGMFSYPAWLGRWPAVIFFIAFAGFLLADPAPADPPRLAMVVGVYTALTVLGCWVFGPRWLLRGEFLTVLMRCYSGTALFGRSVGVPGWRLLQRGAPAFSAALFMLALLAVGSFDGLNETFWWLNILGVNPLEFPGRSAIIGETLVGLGLFLFGLVVVYCATIWLGHMLARGKGKARIAMRIFAPSLLPIAVGYHVAHYLTSFLVDIQYVALFISEHLLDHEFRVTTGFFNTVAAVRLIWLSQAFAVVLGHVVAILVAHVLALRLYGTRRQATLSQIPLAALMIAYTLFGLWLLASPRGA